MATFTVSQAATLTEFLAEQGIFQAWRVPLLVQHGAVMVTRSGSRLKSPDGSTSLVRGDVVAVASPLPASYLKALAGLPASEFWDYAFVPGTDGASGYARQFFTNKPQCKVITGAGPINDTLESFVTALARSLDIDHPIGCPVVVSHANEEGQLFLSLNVLHRNRVIDYEDLEQEAASSRLILDPDLVQPRPPPGRAPAQLRIRGCRIGKAVPFLLKLKEALGGGIQVNAPKHFQYYGSIFPTGGRAGIKGSYEYMAYDFTVSRPSPVANAKALVRAFQRARMPPLIDGSAVPARTWPKLISLRGMPAIHSSGHHILGYNATMIVSNQQISLSNMAEYRYEREELFSGWGAFPLGKDPGKARGRRAAVQAELAKQPLYKANHPYPMWVRMGFDTFDAFMDGWTWRYQYDRGKRQLRYRALRSLYTFVVPITRPGTSDLVMNFYGTNGSPVVEGLHADDAAYYATV